MIKELFSLDLFSSKKNKHTQNNGKTVEDMVTNLHPHLSGAEAVIKARATYYTRNTYVPLLIWAPLFSVVFIAPQIKIALLITNDRSLEHLESKKQTVVKI